MVGVGLSIVLVNMAQRSEQLGVATRPYAGPKCLGAKVVLPWALLSLVKLLVIVTIVCFAGVSGWQSYSGASPCLDGVPIFPIHSDLVSNRRAV